MPHRKHIAELYAHHEALFLAVGGSGGDVFKPHLDKAEAALIEAVLAHGGHVALEHITLTVESMHMAGVLMGRWIRASGDHHGHSKTCDAHERVNLLRTSVKKWRRGPALALDLMSLKVQTK